MRRLSRGFTLVELLVVITILAILMGIAVSAYSGALKSGRLAKRLTDLKSIDTALELYRSDHEVYPISNSWRSECVGGGNLAADEVIPGLVPKYLKIFPSDPKMDKSGNTSCYMYISKEDGTGYKLMDFQVAEFNSDDYLRQRSLIDPTRDGGSDPCRVDGSAPSAFGFYTYNACAL